jgi:Bacteriophage minor capsid protein
MSLLNEIAAKLVALNVGVLGDDLFIGGMPDTPDECVVVYEYGGAPAEKGFGVAGVVYENPSVQVVARGPKPAPGVATVYTGPRAKAEAAFLGLAAVEATTLTGGTSAFYHEITPQASPFLMRRDDSERVLIAVNFAITKELSA